MKIFIYSEEVDFRCEIDGLIGVCKNKIQQDPFSGTLFSFINKKQTAIKLLVYDGQGFWLIQKHLSEGRFRNWTIKDWVPAYDFMTLIWNGNADAAKYHNDLKGL